MRHRHAICHGFCALVLALSFSVPLSAESMGVSHGHDLDELWAKAQKQYDLEAHDAILLLEGTHVSIMDNGNLKTRVHRVVWIGTEMGIEHHADLRVPWNSAASTFTVIALRTWRDGRWWPHESEVSGTAVVETLPFALALADDYTSLRETMLLHDGVELPCIMETIYEIEEEGAAEEGADDLWIIPQDDPALLVEYRLDVPAGVTPVYRSVNGAPEPEKTSGADQTATYTWRMEEAPSLGSPRTENPIVYEPHVIWSTWKDWETLGGKIRSRFDTAAVLNEALVDSLAARLRYEPSEEARARAIVDLMGEWVRVVDYEPGFWRFSPRTAARTWETGYGHALDRAVLAAALFREAGFGARLGYRTPPLERLDREVPALAPFEGIVVRVEGRDVNRIYDPARDSYAHHWSGTHGVTIWEPGARARFIERSVDDGAAPHTAGECEMILTIEPVADGAWKGTGYLRLEYGFSHYDDMAGIDHSALAYIEENVETVLPGTRVISCNPERFTLDDVAFGFELEITPPEPDDRGRMSLTIGEPAAGIMSWLPRDVRLDDGRRSSPVLLGGRVQQRIELRLKPGGREILYVPEPYEIENEVGGFALAVEREDQWLSIERELHLEKVVVRSGEWPLLRTLLLEENDPAHRTIVLR